MNYSVVPASILHIKPLAARLRAAQCASLLAFGSNPRVALRNTFNDSPYRMTALIDGVPVAMWGTQAAVLSDSGLVWLATGTDVLRFPRDIVREAKTQLRKMWSQYSDVRAAVFAEDESALRFAAFLGFRDALSRDSLSRKEAVRDILLKRSGCLVDMEYFPMGDN